MLDSIVGPCDEFYKQVSKSLYKQITCSQTLNLNNAFKICIKYFKMQTLQFLKHENGISHILKINKKSEMEFEFITCSC